MRKETPTDSHAQPARVPTVGRRVPGLLVDPSWLRERRGCPGLRLIDLRAAEVHASGHIPGAASLNLSELGSRMGGCDNVILPPAEFGRLMAGLGVSNGDTVVAYDDNWALAAARLVWALHYYGHDDVAVLNGGWDRWLDEGGESAMGEEPVVPGRFEAKPRPEVFADTEWILGRLEGEGAVLLDTRTRAEFEKGHLPTAVSWDWFNAVPVGSWDASRDPRDLLAEWRSLGFGPSDEVTVYCASGMRASHTYLVLRHAGFPRVRLYDGSWQAWSKVSEAAGGH